MRQNAALDIAVFQDFDAVHACLPVQVALGRQCGVLGDTVDGGVIGRLLWWLPDQSYFSRME